MVTPNDYTALENAYAKKGYAFFNKETFDMNVFGIRNSDPDQSKDEFNDLVGLAYIDSSGNQIMKMYAATTDPGLLELKDPSFAEAKKGGTFIMAEGQYRVAYQLGWHGSGNWRHQALIQVGVIKGYRDRNRNEVLDKENLEGGLYGVNIHASALWGELQQIGRYSAGCQVLKKGVDFADFMNTIKNQVTAGLGNRYTYTLFSESDFE